MSRTDHGAIVAAKAGILRSPHWPTAQHHYLKANPECAACGSTVNVQVHHVFPFHFCILLGRPDLELDPRNFIGLSEREKGSPADETNYHLLLGHADDFQSSNIPVREATAMFYGMSEVDIKAAPIWQAQVQGRCKPWHEWTDDDKVKNKLWLDETYPLTCTPEEALAALVATL